MPFRLQSVLDYRQQLLEQRQQELARCELELQRQLAAVAALHEEIRTVQQSIQTGQARGTLDCNQADSKVRYMGKLADDAQAAQAVADTLAERAEDKRQELVTAMQDKQALEKLKERQAEQDREDRLQKEARDMDEIGVVRFYHQNASREIK